MSFPYNPILYHLDLCILAYQLHAQTLAFPWDPYYESLNSLTGGQRNKMMSVIHRRALKAALKNWGGEELPSYYRGPPAIYWAKNVGNITDSRLDNADPILQRYDRINPHNSYCIRPSASDWLFYNTPKLITGKIKTTFICCRAKTRKGWELSVSQVRSEGNGPDTLIAFEGETGSKSTAMRGSASLLGFTLRRMKQNGNWDLHIVFRGSRSGSANPSRMYSQSGDEGNPDWVTDLGFKKEEFKEVSADGQVHRGFALAMLSALPNIKKACELLIGNGAAPENVYVTGHSLGGGLAQMLCSALLTGDSKLKDNLKLITFAAPRAGDLEWAKHMNKQMGNYPTFKTKVYTTDGNAKDPLGGEFFKDYWMWSRPKDYESVEAQNDPFGLSKTGRRAIRVTMMKDPITTKKGIGGYHVGRTVYADAGLHWKVLNTYYHEPFVIREALAKWIESSYKYKNMTEPRESKTARERQPWSRRNNLRDLGDRLIDNTNLRQAYVADFDLFADLLIDAGITKKGKQKKFFETHAALWTELVRRISGKWRERLT